MADPLPEPDSAATDAAAPASTGVSPDALQGAPSTAPGSLSPPGETRTTRLYRAALGPVNTAHYLQVFERFDAAGRRRLLWHPAAGLFTLGWLVFRRLWTEALAYGLLLVVVVGLCLWAWPVLQTWPAGVRGGVLGAVLLLGVALPGLWGHSLLHRQVQRRLLRAVAAAGSMDEARRTLARQAPARQHLWAVTAVHGAVIVALGWLLVQHDGPRGGAVVAKPTTEAPASAAPPAPLTAAAPTLAPSEPPPLPQTAQLAPPVAPSVAEQVLAERLPDPVPTAAPVEPAPAAMAQAADLAQDAPPAPPATPIAVAYDINVGLFADEGNALRAQQRLQQAGLPVRVQRIGTSQGPRTRVRVGPFAQREAADGA
nr:SPOR domain-containing protein [Hydrogenophaga sp.]